MHPLVENVESTKLHKGQSTKGCTRTAEPQWKLEGNNRAKKKKHTYIKLIHFCLLCLTTIGHTCVLASVQMGPCMKLIIKWYLTNPCREILHSLASIYVEARVQNELRAAPLEQAEIHSLAGEHLNKVLADKGVRASLCVLWLSSILTTT